jgi:hypothetical protein
MLTIEWNCYLQPRRGLNNNFTTARLAHGHVRGFDLTYHCQISHPLVIHQIVFVFEVLYKIVSSCQYSYAYHFRHDLPRNV